jgi:hypothetical protein
MDESGNTGSNILDQEQPYFVIAAFAFRESKVDLIEHMILNARNGLEELKFGSLKRRRNFPTFELLMSELKRNSIELCYSIIEKDFFGGIMCTEYLLDSAYNENVPYETFFTPDIKQSLTATICEKIPITLRQNFIHALAASNKDKLLKAKMDIDRYIIDSKLKEEVFSWILRLREEEFLECTIPPDPGGIEHPFIEHCSPNFHAFSMMIQCLSRLFVREDFSHGKLYFDEQLQYQKSFSWVAKAVNGEKSKHISNPYDDDPSRGITVGPFFNGQVDFLSSNKSKGIQGADLAASSCSWILKGTFCMHELPDYAKAFQQTLLQSVLTGIQSMTTYIAKR